MTDRLFDQPIWARLGEVTDPELDTAHLAYRPDYYSAGYLPLDKPDHSWVNFFQQQAELKIEQWYHSFNLRGSVSSYTDNAIAVDSGGWWLFSDGAWATIAYPDRYSYQSALATVGGNVTAHQADQTNPHGVTPEQANTYSATEVHEAFDDTVGSLSPHIADKGAHGLTVEQVGTLPETGGEFIGDVSVRSLRVGTGVAQAHVVEEDGIRMGTATQRIGVKDGPLYEHDGVTTPLAYSTESFATVRALAGNVFVARPIAEIPLSADLMSWGRSVITVDGVAVFQNGLQVSGVTSATITLDGGEKTVVAYVDGVGKYTVTSSDTLDLIAVFAPATTIKSVRVFEGTLTEYQLSGEGTE